MKSQKSFSDKASNPPLSLVAVILFVVISAVYLNSLKNPFFYDDYGLIKDNRALSEIANLRNLFSRAGYFSKFKESTYRPLISGIYLLGKQVFGDNPVSWRLLNLAVHFLNCLLLFLVLQSLRLSGLLSLFSVILFAVHPVHTELINVISFNEDLIGGFFCLLAIYGYYREGLAWRTSSWLSYFISCFAKETFLVLPFLFFLFAWYREDSEVEKKDFWFSQAGYLLMALLFLLINFHLMTNPNPVNRPPFPGGSIFTALLTFAVVLLYYLKLFFLPVGLTPVYDFPAYTSILQGAVLASLIFLGIVAVLWVYGLRRRQLWVPYLGWFLLFLLPTSNVIPFWAILAERYLYFPLMGLIPGALLLLKLLLEKIGRGFAGYQPAFILVFFLFFGVLTINRNAVWQSPETLWQDTLAKMSNASAPHLSLAIHYGEQDNYDKAIFHFNKAIETEPMHPLPYSNLARFYSKRGMYLEARENYEKAIALKAGYYDLETYYYDVLNLGDACIQLEDYPAAIKYLRVATLFNPDHPAAYFNLALVYEELGKVEEAKKAKARYEQLSAQ